MKKMLKKSEVLREGYIAGLKKAKSVINEMLGGSDTIDMAGHPIPAEFLDGLEQCELDDIVSWNVFDMMSDEEAYDLCEGIRVYDTYEEMQDELGLGDYDDEIDMNPRVIELGSTGRFVYFA